MPPEVLAAGGRDYIRHVVNLVRQVSEAAHALHEAGVIHRDIKPENILVTPDGMQAVLMDLGLAQLADESEGRLTRTRQFVGTLRYASPEQVLSVPLDRRSDVYSLGATLWELLTLRPLFGATDQTPDARVDAQDPIGRPREPPADQSQCAGGSECHRAEVPGKGPLAPLRLGRGTGGRPEPLAEWRSVQAQPPSLRYMMGKYVRRHRLPIAAAVAATIAMIALTATVIIARARDQAVESQIQAQNARDNAEVYRKKAETALGQEQEANRKAQAARDQVKLLSDELQSRIVENVDIKNGFDLHRKRRHDRCAPLVCGRVAAGIAGIGRHEA